MHCDRCGQTATIHEVTIRNGKRAERHLCEACALALGLMKQPGTAPVSDLLSELASASQDAAALLSSANPALTGHPKHPSLIDPSKLEPGIVGRCPRCSATMAQLRDTGLLGCPMCYEAFLPQLIPLLERYHECGLLHRGKVPKRLSSGLPPQGPTKAKRKTKSSADSPETPIESPEALAARQREIIELKTRLAEALASEDYRQAAAIRDRILALASGPPKPLPAPSKQVEPDPPTGSKAGPNSSPGSAA